MGKLQSQPIQQQVRRRVVKAGNKNNKEIYRAIAETREKEQIKQGKLTMTERIHQLYEEAKQIGRSGTEKEKGNLTKNMNITMEAVVQELLTIENQQYNESNQSKTKNNTREVIKRDIYGAM